MKTWIMAMFGMAASAANAAPPPTIDLPSPSRPLPYEPLGTPMPPPPPPLFPPSAPSPISPDREAAFQAQRARRAEIVASQQRLITFDIEVRGNKDLIWSGSLRIRGNGNGSSYTQSKQDAAALCPGENGSARQMAELRITLSRIYSSEDVDRFSVAANWSRPQDDCPDGVGIQTVSFQRLVGVKAGETRELIGDGGLVVKLTRRG